ncbi:hypothetical protein T01_15207 [Trichinella spiralis]|uniref:DUF7107 domain-containing protein n=1 Tax=Trichinella spiralis TaxID=6334 RepID=A0A0V1AXC8_TRISP|nr:hypothetical protein T01_15207 [Trichinella spiralis]
MHFANLFNLIIKNIQRVGMTKNKEITYTVIKTFFIFFCMQEIGPGLFVLGMTEEERCILCAILTGNHELLKNIGYYGSMGGYSNYWQQPYYGNSYVYGNNMYGYGYGNGYGYGSGYGKTLHHRQTLIIRTVRHSAAAIQECLAVEAVQLMKNVVNKQYVVEEVVLLDIQVKNVQAKVNVDLIHPAVTEDVGALLLVVMVVPEINVTVQTSVKSTRSVHLEHAHLQCHLQQSAQEMKNVQGVDVNLITAGFQMEQAEKMEPQKIQPNQNQRCSTQADCGANQICSDVHKNLCTDGYSLGIPCTKEGDCDRKDVCKNNVCWREGQDNGLPANERCKKQDECKANTVCEDEKCQNAIVTTKKCLMQMNCKSAEACRFGYCWSVTNDLIDENNPMTPCKTQADCGPGTICSDIHANKCMKAHTTTVPCKKEKDCYAKDVCKDGECWVEGEDKGFPPGTSCTKDEQCTATAVCEGKTCKLATRTDKKCRMEFTCGRSSACKYGYCWNVEAGGSEEIKEEATGDCTKQADCGPDEICSDIHKNKCYKAHSIGTPCTKERDCSRKDVCKDGTCWKEGTDRGAPIGSACRKDNECAATLVCEKDECRQGVITKKKCTFEASCGKRAACRYSYCWNIA